ncbi:unnamed protein product [Oikopleura dioica]|uniref:Uncharacterized protein n=1 Tax=Oikopleura dioica TaxID=34765 RepID=E4Y0L8_OIKDI|nr:unnamed protein product [Oikopleura dioica]
MPTATIVETIKKQEQLDSNCQIFLCLQDLGMRNFLAQMDQAVPKELGATAVERAMIILTNGNNWDMNTLKRWDEPNVVTDKTRVAALLSKSYNNIVPICVQDDALDPEAKQFINQKDSFQKRSII